jgi:uncharacterized membrane protein YcaP (DUF421 family)
MDGTPVLIVDKWELQRETMERERADEHDILHAARDLQGLGTLDEIEYAILDQTGEMTIILKKTS